MLISAKLSPMNWAVCLAKILMPGGEEGTSGVGSCNIVNIAVKTGEH